ncbi:hypothetical protein CPB83DRAFT_512942 [Crepidotus variabilis]|uniref:F-box domain-containing protein n=1 Tax=Crepidotus variabilis TaxID=179855 RepID=A0A9P6JM94_9AGAR|nr:hypothetical protein CPB83DRAFT_512942 [Crepidotus variabilis]
MSLPTEILNHILSFLRRDVKSLKACARASPLLVPLAERHLYAQIVLLPRLSGDVFSDHDLYFNLSQLAKLIRTRPHVAPCIESIRVMITYQDLMAWLYPPISGFADHGSPPHLPSLKVFAVTLRGLRFKPIRWNLFPETLRAYLENMIHLPTIEEITIQGVLGFPLKILNGCWKLGSLELDGGGCILDPKAIQLSSPPEGIISHPPRVRLRHLYLQRGDGPIDEIVSWLKPERPHLAVGTPESNLEHLLLHFGGAYSGYWQEHEINS